MAQADIPIMAGPWCPGGDEATIRSQYQTWRNMGVNAFYCSRHQEDYRDDPAAMYWYDRVYDLAVEYEIKITWYTSTWRYKYRNPNNNQMWIDRYKVKASCGGWVYGDEPAARPDPTTCWDHAGTKAVHDDLNARDPSHPAWAIWTVAIYRNHQVCYKRTCRPNWCELYDVASVDCYPWYSGHDLSWLEYWIEEDYSNAKGDGFGDCGKGMIPVVQAFPAGGDPPNRVVLQYEAWKKKYGYSGIKGVMLWRVDTVLGSTEREEDVRNLARLRGWTEEPPPPPPETFTIQETTCPQDRSVFRVKVSSVAENNKALACPVDGTALPLRGVEITEIVAIPLIETLKEEIVALDKKIAELQGRIETLRAQKAEAIEILGV